MTIMPPISDRIRQAEKERQRKAATFQAMVDIIDVIEHSYLTEAGRYREIEKIVRDAAHASTK